jgi:hypothetical protein
MSSQVRNAFLSLVFLLGIAVFAYHNFSSFRPKRLIPLKEVHGTKTSIKVNLPYPEGAIVLGATVSGQSSQKTLKVDKTSEEVQTFYANVLETDGWVLDNKGETGIFVMSEYKRGKDRVKIATSGQMEFEDTVISIEINSL